MKIGRRKRKQARNKGGRFVRNTPENTLGLHIVICKKCGGLNPYPVYEEAPERCGHCDETLTNKDVKKCPECGLSGPVPVFIDPFKFRRGLICKVCSREID